MLKNLLNGNKTLFAPSILAGDFANIERSVKHAEKCGADLIHLDVMDGVYVSNLTFGMPMVEAVRRVTGVPLDVHLMITKPEKHIKEFVRAGADIITFHPDASENPLKTLMTIKENGILGGIALNPDIEIDNYLNLFPLCDMVLIMSVFAGYGGQPFIKETLLKVERIKKEFNVPVEIDGGINSETAVLAKNAGASILVAGSAFFKAENPKGFAEILKK